MPVVHVGVNLQTPWEAGLGSEQGTDYFVNFYGLEVVGNDYRYPDKHQTRRHFSKSDVQPIFTIINGVADSPAHAQWQVLVNEVNGILSSGFPWRDVIDGVRPAVEPSLNLGPPSFTEEGELTFLLTGPAGEIYGIEVTRDFLGWESAGTVTNVTGSVEFRESSTASSGWGFYRAVRR